MRLVHVRHLSGPNTYSTAPVSVARLELGELTNAETTEYPGFAGRLAEQLPGLAGHHCAAGRPGGFTAAMGRGTYFGHVTEHVALELSALAGREVHLGRTVWAGHDVTPSPFWLLVFGLPARLQVQVAAPAWLSPAGLRRV